MKNYIVDKETLKILYIYEGDKQDFGGAWGDRNKTLDIEAAENSTFELDGEDIVAVPDTVLEKSVAKQTAVESYHNDVYSQMEATFGTRNTDTANANHETYKMMSSDPGVFISSNIKDDDGNDLDTNQKVEDYANARLLEIATYAAYRMQRKQQFKDELETIENS